MFIRFDVIHERDGQTDKQTLHDRKDRACIASRGKNYDYNVKPFSSNTGMSRTDRRTDRQTDRQAGRRTDGDCYFNLASVC